MTKKLDKMMKKRPRSKKSKKTKKMTKKQRLAVRGIALEVGYKKTMDLMAEHIKEQGRVVPPVFLSFEDPASAFAIAMYEEIGQWDDMHCRLFIFAVTKKKAKFTQLGAMHGTVKAIFHALFEDGATKEEVNHYSSSWKMWPNVRSKLKKKERRKMMATDKKVGKKAAKTKKVGKKKAPAKNKKAAKKKVSKKKSSGRLSPMTGDTKLTKKKASCGESAAWDDVLDCMGKKAMTFDKLCAVVDKKLDGDEVYTRRVVGSLRRRGCIAAAD